MKTLEIMTKDVVTVAPDTPVQDIARLMAERHISGLPVVQADGTIAGIVSHSDLLHRPETGTEPRRRRWVDLFADPDRLARAYTKTHGMKASDIMSRNVISVDAHSELREAADILDKRDVKRVPVLENGRLVGILSRGDVVRAFAELPRPAAVPADDVAVQKAIEKRFAEQNWLDATFVSVLVRDGVAELSGIIRSEAQRAAVETMVEETAGVAKVRNALKVHTQIGMGI